MVLILSSKGYGKCLCRGLKKKKICLCCSLKYLCSSVILTSCLLCLLIMPTNISIFRCFFFFLLIADLTPATVFAGKWGNICIPFLEWPWHSWLVFLITKAFQFCRHLLTTYKCDVNSDVISILGEKDPRSLGHPNTQYTSSWIHWRSNFQPFDSCRKWVK